MPKRTRSPRRSPVRERDACVEEPCDGEHHAREAEAHGRRVGRALEDHATAFGPIAAAQAQGAGES